MIIPLPYNTFHTVPARPPSGITPDGTRRRSMGGRGTTRHVFLCAYAWHSPGVAGLGCLVWRSAHPSPPVRLFSHGLRLLPLVASVYLPPRPRPGLILREPHDRFSSLSPSVLALHGVCCRTSPPLLCGFISSARGMGGVVCFLVLGGSPGHAVVRFCFVRSFGDAHPAGSLGEETSYP